MARIPPVTYLTGSIIRILGCNPYAKTIQGTNTYLLGTGNKRILIDTGDPDVIRYIEHLSCVLREEKATISIIILTHWHIDHVGGLKNILGTYMVDPDCKVYKFPLEEAAACNKLVAIPSNVTVLDIKDKQLFAVDGIEVRAEHTPGHAADHIILQTELGAVFSGDCIVVEGTPTYENFADYISNLHKILKLRPCIIYPSHGNVITNPIKRLKSIIGRCNHLEAKILKFLRDNPTIYWDSMDIVKNVYRDSPKSVYLSASCQIEDHLSKLRQEGKIEHLQGSDPQTFRYVSNSGAQPSSSNSNRNRNT